MKIAPGTIKSVEIAGENVLRRRVRQAVTRLSLLGASLDHCLRISDNSALASQAPVLPHNRELLQ